MTRRPRDCNSAMDDDALDSIALEDLVDDYYLCDRSEGGGYCWGMILSGDVW